MPPLVVIALIWSVWTAVLLFLSGHVVQWRACRNQRFALDALLELLQELAGRSHDPGVHILRIYRLPLFGIGDQVDDVRVTERRSIVEKIPLLDEENLEVPPLDTVQAFSYPDQAAFAVRLLLPPEEERSLIDAVDHPILRHLAPGPPHKRREHVHLVNQLIA